MVTRTLTCGTNNNEVYSVLYELLPEVAHDPRHPVFGPNTGTSIEALVDSKEYRVIRMPLYRLAFRLVVVSNSKFQATIQLESGYEHRLYSPV